MTTQREIQDWLEAVETTRPVIELHRENSEKRGNIAPEIVQAFCDAGLIGLKMPKALGGAETDPIIQFKVFEQTASIDGSSAWIQMIYNTSAAIPAAFLPDSTARQLFSDDRIPVFTTVIKPIGQAIPESGGYRLSGTGHFASGIRHAEWINAVAIVPEEGPRMFTFPAANAQIHDDWQVLGLRGTGSNSFSVSELFVSKEFTCALGDIAAGLPQRGGPLYRLGIPAFIINEHMALAFGIAWHALEEVQHIAKNKHRAYGPPRSSVANDPVFQQELGNHVASLRTLRRGVLDLLREMWQVVCSQGTIQPSLQAELRAVAVVVTDAAGKAVDMAFRYGGAEGIFESHVLAQCKRDMDAAAQHLMVSRKAYRNLSQFLLGVPDADPMA